MKKLVNLSAAAPALPPPSLSPGVGDSYLLFFFFPFAQLGLSHLLFRSVLFRALVSTIIFFVLLELGFYGLKKKPKLGLKIESVTETIKSLKIYRF